jgi:hypothetical protein
VPIVVGSIARPIIAVGSGERLPNRHAQADDASILPMMGHGSAECRLFWPNGIAVRAAARG